MVEVDRCFIPICQCSNVEVEIHSQHRGVGRNDFQERRIGKAQTRKHVVPCSIHTVDDGFSALFDERTKLEKELRALRFPVLLEQIGRFRQRVWRHL